MSSRHVVLGVSLSLAAAATSCTSESRYAPTARSQSCSPDGRSRPSGFPDGDYKHFIFHGGRLYASDFPQPATAPTFGRRLGVVTCRFSGSMTPLDYSASREGEAGFLDVGTPFYAVQGQPEAEVIAAEYDGKPRVFQSFPHRSECDEVAPHPLEQSCPPLSG